MLKGSVNFKSKINDCHISFQRFSHSPGIAGVEAVELECATGEEISGLVLISETANSGEGMILAKGAFEAVLNKLSYMHNTAIEPAQVTASEFSPVDPTFGNHLHAGTGYFQIKGFPVRMVQCVSNLTLKAEMEKASPAGEAHYSIFRSARLSIGPVEEFMQLYSILLQLLEDKQKHVDEFILVKEPHVPKTQSPQFDNVMETIYTRLRNELAHKRANVSIESNRIEMQKHVGNLRALVRLAIKEH